MKITLGTALTLLICLVTINLWVISKEDIAVVPTDPLLSLSQILSLLSIVLMSVSLTLTTRLKFIENLFGGLDKVYQTHRLLGGIAFIFIINHPLLLAAKTANTSMVSMRYLFPSGDLSYTSGVLALYLFILAFIFMVFIKLPYHLWKRLHSILGIAFLLGVIHVLLISSDVSRSALLRNWIILWISLGNLSVIYTIFFYKRFGHKYHYIVDRLERKLDFINIWLKPGKSRMNFDPGQFAYIKFKTAKTGEELHPYSFSSADYEDNVRFSIKMVGDYTLQLPNLKEGDTAEVFGPHGNFGHAYKVGDKDQCWIAGGIGVTPYLSMLRKEYKNRSSKRITFFYCYSNPDEGVYADEINLLIKELDNVVFINWCSREKGRLDAKKIAGVVGNLYSNHISICGPRVMMEQLKKQFLNIGVCEECINYERFQLV